MDRCTVGIFNEVDRTVDQTSNKFLTYEGDGLQYLYNISTGISTRMISSHPVRVCPCINDRQNCSHKFKDAIKIQSGDTFSLSVIAVDHVYKPANATITGYLNSTYSNLFKGQVTEISDFCAKIIFQIVSPHRSEQLTLYASDGPCKDAELSRLRITVSLEPCTCPIGFERLQSLSNFCECTCHHELYPYVENCNGTEKTFRRKINVWISYINMTTSTSLPSGYIVYKYCPLDYCSLPNKYEKINLTEENGSDSQCAFERTGVLCGSCKPGLSISLGSSKCVKCPRYWPALFVVITVIALLAGLAMVALILWLNMTVAVGTLNGLLFYVNIVSANRVVLLQSHSITLFSIFLSWLNLELGIDICYFKGLDTFIKTWLQLAFPIYIIFLVVLVIIVCHYSTKFSEFISKRDPVATLATLILISYGKLFDVILLAQQGRI